MAENPVAIEERRLRVEFEGKAGPTHLVIPLVFQPGKHSDVKIRIVPRKGISLRNEVAIGDALQMTFSHSHAISAGLSFFATASHSRTFSMVEKQYEVFSLPDFRGILLLIRQFNVREEAVGVQMAFPISYWEPSSNEDYFAEISLEIKGKVVQNICVPREVHPRAGKVLYLNGLSSDFRHANYQNWDLPKREFPYLRISEIKHLGLNELVNELEQGFNGIHFRTNVSSLGSIHLCGSHVSSHDFFQSISGFGLKFIYIDTCNSVGVVSSFRTTDISALIASTEILWDEYANEFEKLFYDALGNGAFMSEAFHHAALLARKCDPLTRSGTYNPMFLDLKTDFSFCEKL